MTHEIIDAFAGAGGWDLAARELGVRAHGIDNMKEARATRETNGLSTIGSDVWDMDTWAGQWGNVYRPDTFVASPPCQAFSAAGNGEGRKALTEVITVLNSDLVMHPEDLKAEALQWGDERIGLVLTPLTYVLRYRPRFVALEQVPTVLPVWEAMAERMQRSGYLTWTGLCQAEQYGVPQTRKRAILIARLDGVQPERPAPTHSRYYPRDPKRLDPDVKPWVTMAEALGWGASERPAPVVTGGGNGGGGGAEPFGNGSRQRLNTEQADGRWVMQSTYSTDSDYQNRGEREPDQPAPTVTTHFDRNHWVNNRPSTTIVGSFRPEIVAAPGYRKAGDPSRQNAPGSVRVTLEEAAQLQGFPADYVWAGGRGKQFLQVGNAVPVGLAKAVLTELWRDA